MPAKKIKKEKKFEMGSSEEMQESFQNDRTRGLPEEAYTQEGLEVIKTIAYTIVCGNKEYYTMYQNKNRRCK